KRTKTRFAAGSNGTVAPAPTKIPKVGVAFESIVVETVEPAVPRHCPVDGLVWQMARLSGRVAGPGSILAVIVPAAPTFTVATANAPPLMVTSTMPGSLLAAKATMSGTGLDEPESRIVLTPEIGAALVELAQPKATCTSVGAKAAVGVVAKTNVCVPLL